MTLSPRWIQAQMPRHEIADCDRKLARRRAALEAGADAVMVAEWTNEVRQRRAAAADKLAAGSGSDRAPTLSPGESAAVV